MDSRLRMLPSQYVNSNVPNKNIGSFETPRVFSRSEHKFEQSSNYYKATFHECMRCSESSFIEHYSFVRSRTASCKLYLNIAVTELKSGYQMLWRKILAFYQS